MTTTTTTQSADKKTDTPTDTPSAQQRRRGGGDTAKRFFSAYAQTWLGLSPIWLMAEAVLPNSKFGSQFSKGRRNLASAAEDVRELVASSGRDVVVIVDEKLLKGKLKGEAAGKGDIVQRTSEVLKAAGENAILVVTSSFDKLSAQLSPPKDKSHPPSAASTNLKLDTPALKRSLQKHGRDALVLLDKSLKHPVVITGVSGFARTRGIPHADALLRLASLGLSKILRSIPEVVVDVEMSRAEGAHIEEVEEVEEIDAEDLERRSTLEEREQAETIGRVADTAADPPMQDGDAYAEMKKRSSGCLVM